MRRTAPHQVAALGQSAVISQKSPAHPRCAPKTITLSAVKLRGGELYTQIPANSALDGTDSQKVLLAPPVDAKAIRPLLQNIASQFQERYPGYGLQRIFPLSALLVGAVILRIGLLPQLTKAQRNAIPTPATGLIINQTDNTPGPRVCIGGSWFIFNVTAD
jgi:hypothetical protein